MTEGRSCNGKTKIEGVFIQISNPNGYIIDVGISDSFSKLRLTTQETPRGCFSA